MKKYEKLSIKKIILIQSFLILFLIIGFAYKSFAIYKIQEDYDVIKQKINGYSSGDVVIASIIDGKETNTFPSYETNYKVLSVDCTNGATGSFDVENWEIKVADMPSTSTKCTVSFDSTRKNTVTPVNMSKKEILALNEEITTTSAKQLANYLYPVGSIYISTEDDSVEKVETKFGGTWVGFGEDMTLVGASSTKEVNSTGGASSVTLTTDNLPSHSHVIPSLSGTAKSAGAHTHMTMMGYGTINWAAGDTKDATARSYAVNGQTGSSGAHTHSVATNASNTTTCTNCSSSAFSVQNPYITVYMYKRTA